MKRMIVGAALAVSLVGAVAPVAGASNAFSATCSASGDSSFTAARSGRYGWVWRTGTTVNGYGSQYVNAGQTITVDTPDGVDGSSKFGVVTKTSRT